MKKYFPFFFIFIFLSCKSFAQEVMVDIAKKYYRSNPFEKEFSQFLNHLMNDPTLENKIINKKTDSTLFFLEGTYSTHDPFFFKARKTKVILAESEDVETEDSVQYLQTTYLYQLVAYASPNEEGIRSVRDEFEKICRHYKKKFEEDNYKELKNKNIQVGEIRDYTLKYRDFFPFTVAWATSKEQSNNIIAITIRFRVFNNLAYFPIAGD